MLFGQRHCTTTTRSEIGFKRAEGGLGLAICESAMRRMGGDFILEPAVKGKGATFRMKFQAPGAEAAFLIRSGVTGQADG